MQPTTHGDGFSVDPRGQSGRARSLLLTVSLTALPTIAAACSPCEALDSGACLQGDAITVAEANQRITEVAEFWTAEDYHVSRSPLRGLVIALVPYPDLGFGTRSDYSPGEYIRIAVRDVPHPTVLGALGHEVSARSK